MKYLITLILCISYCHSFSQKLQVYCPEITDTLLRTDKFAGENITIILTDVRNLPKNTKAECSSENVLEAVFQQLQQTYPKAIFTKDNALYAQQNIPGKYIKIAVAAYHAGSEKDFKSAIIPKYYSSDTFKDIPEDTFTAGTVLAFEIKTTDKPYLLVASQFGRQVNEFDHTTSKKALTFSFNKVFNEFVRFID